MGIYTYQKGRWCQHQSTVTSFMDLLSKNKNKIYNEDLYLVKLLELNQLYDQIEHVIDDIKHECILSGRCFKDNKKIQQQINEHLHQKETIKKLVCLEPLLLYIK